MYQQHNFKLPSVMGHDFSRAPQANISRSQLNLSCGYKSAFDAGYLIPFYWEEVLPGDTFNVKASILARLATPLYPLMDNLHLDLHWFFAPERLLWSNWERFMGQRDNPDDTIDFVMPVVTPPTSGFGALSIYDYLGLTPGKAGSSSANPFTPRAGVFRMYNRTWNEWFRDENLQDSVILNLDDGPDASTDYTILRRGKRHDYFTSCLPWPQKGDPVNLPLGTSAPVLGIGRFSTDTTWATTSGSIMQSSGVLTTATAGSPWNTMQLYVKKETDSPVSAAQPDIFADLTNATSATINDLIHSFAIQDLLTRDARGGTRYTEILQSHFGVTSPDARLQRVEYLGGSSKPLSFYTVPQTSPGGDGTFVTETPLGRLSAYAEGVVQNQGFIKSFIEHGIILGLVSVRADLNYQQGNARKWSRSTRYDFYWPSLANLGEQAVLNKEIYVQGTSADDDVFGYQERWAEYRYANSLVTSLMRSTYPQSLDAWHLAQEFDALPVLNSEFIEEDPPIDRVIAVPSEPHIIFDSFINVIAARPMPVYSIPGLRGIM